MTYTARDICYNTRQANATLNYVCNNPPRIVAWNQTVSLRYGAEVRGPAWHSRVGRWTCSVSCGGTLKSGQLCRMGGCLCKRRHPGTTRSH